MDRALAGSQIVERSDQHRLPPVEGHGIAPASACVDAGVVFIR
jgi:hypothetical protein